MKKLLISAAIGASALGASVLLGTNAQAADNLMTSEYYAGQAPMVERVRMVCDEFDRCWREPRRKTVIIERDDDDDDDYAPPQRYIEYDAAPRARVIERRYHDHRPPADIGIHAPGVTVGVGTGGYRW
ncbi:hypothetical protein [Bradyrhizobium sp. LHD-71]|uniref:hypothetical protein n=1 Tax=Bradyrhizobium sp. LHD-71 TaxID=3072141 RepID=UPI00280DA986|nr:hypothetical protein [Bradyrhizobium sp. LHD-71]MDQ8731026.1 hypothetical protein [Bradyrhizobium sp. LHD-71]